MVSWIKSKLFFSSLLIALTVTQACLGMNSGSTAPSQKKSTAAWVGTYFGSIINDLLSGTAEGAVMGKDGAEKALQKLVDGVKKLQHGKAYKDLKQLLKDNRNTIIFNFLLVTAVTGGATAFFLGLQHAVVAFWTHGGEILKKYILMRMDKPHVIIDSSAQESYSSRLLRFILRKKAKFPEMILGPETEQRAENTIKQTKRINQFIRSGKKGVTYRNLVLWGPPGTGKTMFARALARISDLEWVEVTGSSFFTKNAGIAAIDDLFDWAKNSRRGLLIFIDEADSLLPDRSKMDPNSDNYKIINHFLNYLGTKSDKFMIVMSTNHKIVFDPAMRRRIHDSIHFPLPGLQERIRLLDVSIRNILFDERKNSPEFVESAEMVLGSKQLEPISQKIEGFSYDEIVTLVETIKSLVDISEDGLVTQEILQQSIAQQIENFNEFSDNAHAVKAY